MTTDERPRRANPARFLRRPGAVVRVLLLVMAVLLLVPAAVGFGVHFWTTERSLGLGLVAAAPYLAIAAPVALVLALVARHWRVTGLALVLVVANGFLQVPLFVASDVPTNGTSLRVMTANLHVGTARASDVVSEVAHHRVDVLMLQELTGTEQTALTRAGLDRALPYHVSVARQNAEGSGLWSRYPLTDERTPGGFALAFVTARVRVPGSAATVTLVALHMSGPVPDAAPWVRDIGRLPGVLRALPASGPVVVGGDFNATPDTVQFRHVLDAGYADAADQAGAGIAATYPADRGFPPLIAIDHVLTRGAVADTADTLHLGGTDHRALLSTVVLPRTTG